MKYKLEKIINDMEKLTGYDSQPITLGSVYKELKEVQKAIKVLAKEIRNESNK